jgi:hypothetical protein
METVEPIPGLRLEADPAASDRFDGPPITVTLDAVGVKAVATHIWDLVAPDDMARFFRGLDRESRGWTGAKRFATVEDMLTLEATHDGEGDVTLWVGLLENWRGYERFRVSTQLVFDAGSAADAADKIDDWVAWVFPALRER